MSADWDIIKISGFGEVITGKTPSTKRSELYGEKYPFITPTDLECDSAIPHAERALSEEGFLNQKNLLLPANTICFTCIGATIGKMCITKQPSFTNQQINSIIVDHGRYDYWFVYYLLRTQIESIKGRAGGAATPIVNKTVFSNVEVAVPPLPIQKKIAGILSAYDDLIENNSRRIKILEEMAQAIYQEWFVKFKFPGHEKVRMVDSELGKIPQEWEIKKLEGYVDFERGVEPGSKNYKEKCEEGDMPFLRVGDLGSRNIELYIDSKLTKGKVLKEDNIAVSLDGTPGIVKIGLFGCYSTGIRKLLIKNHLIKTSFLYFLMLSEHIQNTIKAHSKGTTILHAGESIKYMNFILPEKGLMNKFDELVSPMISSILLLNKKNKVLQCTRDLLLPKLISGEIDVEDLDIDVGELAE